MQPENIQQINPLYFTFIITNILKKAANSIIEIVVARVSCALYDGLAACEPS